MREHFASMAMQGIVTGIHGDKESVDLMLLFSTKEGDSGVAQTVSQLAVEYADALITALAKAPSSRS